MEKSSLPADRAVNERMAAFEARTSNLQTDQCAMQHSIDNLTSMIRLLLPPDSATYASISAYVTELKLDRDEFLALTTNSSSLSQLNTT